MLSSTSQNPTCCHSTECTEKTAFYCEVCDSTSRCVSHRKNICGKSEVPCSLDDRIDNDVRSVKARKTLEHLRLVTWRDYESFKTTPGTNLGKLGGTILIYMDKKLNNLNRLEVSFITKDAMTDPDTQQPETPIDGPTHHAPVSQHVGIGESIVQQTVTKENHIEVDENIPTEVEGTLQVVKTFVDHCKTTHTVPFDLIAKHPEMTTLALLCYNIYGRTDPPNVIQRIQQVFELENQEAKTIEILQTLFKNHGIDHHISEEVAANKDCEEKANTFRVHLWDHIYQRLIKQWEILVLLPQSDDTDEAIQMIKSALSDPTMNFQIIQQIVKSQKLKFTWTPTMDKYILVWYYALQKRVKITNELARLSSNKYGSLEPFEGQKKKMEDQIKTIWPVKPRNLFKKFKTIENRLVRIIDKTTKILHERSDDTTPPTKKIHHE
jgi:hypothetical protein